MTAAEHLNPRQFFHVSGAEFKPGDRVLPRRDLPGVHRTEGGTGDAEHVYLSRDPHAAVGNWATTFGDAEHPQHVYAVRPKGPVDKGIAYADDPGSAEYTARSARVVQHVGTLRGDYGVNAVWEHAPGYAHLKPPYATAQERTP